MRAPVCVVGAFLILVSSGPAQAEDNVDVASIRARVFQTRSPRPTEHRSTVGVVLCRDPQIRFETRAWKEDERLREHMLIDLLKSGNLLGKDRSYIDSVFEPCKPHDQGSSVRYDLTTGSRRGNAPSSSLEIVYNSLGQVSKYRAVYRVDGVNLEPDNSSAWTE